MALGCAAISYAQEGPHAECDTVGIRADQRPAPLDQPTEVAVGLRVVDITGIEDTTQTVTIDFVTSIQWTDQRFHALEGCEFSRDEAWTPQIDIVNSGRLFTRLKGDVEVLDNGRLRQLQRFRGSLVFSYDAHRFPFDQQNIDIILLSEKFSKDEVVLSVDTDVTGRNPDTFNIADWKIGDVHARIFDRHFEVYNSDHSAYKFYISAERRSGYFIWKVILPLMLIVFMSWTVFWINPSQFGPQISMSATSMLTLIAFQFAMGNILPRLSYFTVMDRFITGSTILVFLALIESIITNYLVTIDKEALALKMDRICCWLFPTVFLIFLLITFNS